MECPRCDVNMKCGCQSCQSNPQNRNKPGVVQIQNRETDIISCGNCGQSAHIDEWHELSYLIYDRKRRQKANVA